VAARSLVRCQTPGCAGVLGAWAAGAYLPAGHLLGGRDWYGTPAGAILVRCSRCNTWYGLERAAGRWRLVSQPAGAGDGPAG
jgi:hypothetical protein